jgi:hypothetical protein
LKAWIPAFAGMTEAVGSVPRKLNGIHALSPADPPAEVGADATAV